MLLTFHVYACVALFCARVVLRVFLVLRLLCIENIVFAIVAVLPCLGVFIVDDICYYWPVSLLLCSFEVLLPYGGRAALF